MCVQRKHECDEKRVCFHSHYTHQMSSKHKTQLNNDTLDGGNELMLLRNFNTESCNFIPVYLVSTFQDPGKHTGVSSTQYFQHNIQTRLFLCYS